MRGDVGPCIHELSSGEPYATAGFLPGKGPLHIKQKSVCWPQSLTVPYSESMGLFTLQGMELRFIGLPVRNSVTFVATTVIDRRLSPRQYYHFALLK
jgi:hypothetical protein